MVREEYNLPLTREAYEHLLPKIDGLLIEKTRYLIPLEDSRTAELDVFEGSLAPLVVVEVEFDTVEAANAFCPPDWFGEDVTSSGKYHNSTLSRQGLPS
jgi:CYTH domain-containing protein